MGLKKKTELFLLLFASKTTYTYKVYSIYEKENNKDAKQYNINLDFKIDKFVFCL